MPLISPKRGYDRYAPFYRNDYDHIDSFDWNFCQEKIWYYLESNTSAVLLDAGCGDGRILTRIARRFCDVKLWGWDISEKMLAIAAKRTKHKAKLFQHDVSLQSPPEASPSGGFDIVCAFFVLVHLKTPDVFFSNLHRVMKDRGILIFNTIAQRRALTLSDNKGDFVIEYYNHSEAAIAKILMNQGFILIERKQFEHSTVFIVKAEK